MTMKRFFGKLFGDTSNFSVEGRAHDTVRPSGAFKVDQFGCLLPYLTEIEDGFEVMVYQATLMGSARVPFLMPKLYREMPAGEVDRHIAKELYSEGYGLAGQGVTMPSIALTTEENDEYKIISTDINAYVQNYIAECVTGLISIEGTWDDFQATLKQMGVERMVEIYGNAYARAIG